METLRVPRRRFLLFQIVDHQTGDAPTIGDDLSKK
jgi:hypothetical protein